MCSLHSHVHTRMCIRNSQVTVVRTIEINILYTVYRSSERLTKYYITEKKWSQNAFFFETKPRNVFFKKKSETDQTDLISALLINQK